AVRGAAGGPVLTQAHHRAGRVFLERTNAAHSGYSHLYRVAGPAHSGRGWRGDFCHHRAHVRRRSFLGEKARTNSWRVLSGDSGRVGGWIFIGWISRTAL